jgi:hypothetical protein
MSVRVSPHFGIVVRRRALARLNIDETKLLSLMETEAAYDADPELISFGPHFGEEAAEEFVRRLKNLGLEYAEDFFQVSSEVPDWCGMSCFVVQET